MVGFKLLFIAHLLNVVFSQAPGDSDSLCVDELIRNGAALVTNPLFTLQPVYSSNLKPLMDSKHYVNLLNIPNPVWQQVGNDTFEDDNNSSVSFTILQLHSSVSG